MKLFQRLTDNATLKSLGPGLITGAADDDPSGIATYSQAGAQFGFNTLWTLVLTYPFMVGIQLVSARIGRVTGLGLAGNIRRAYPVWLLYTLVFLLLVANIVNISADIAAMGEAARLVAGAGSAHLYSFGFGMLCLVLQLLLPYSQYVRYLKWLTLGLLAYVATGFAIHIPWGEVLARTVKPHFAFTKESVAIIVAIFGTTISPYLFFWQASQEVEEIRADDDAHALRITASGCARTAVAHETRHRHRHGLFECRRLLHHAHRRRHARRLRHHRTSRPRPRRPKHCAPSPATSRSGCLHWASPAPACWPCPCWRARPRMR